MGTATLTTSKPDGIVVFDFDGTITTHDTFALFLRFYAGTFGWIVRILSLAHIFLAYLFKMVDRHTVKAQVIRKFFAGESVEHVNARASEFAKTVIPKLIRPAAQAELEVHKFCPESLYICSASISPYLNVWGADQGISNILATDLESVDGRYTGEIKGWNVWGQGKIRRLEAEFATQTLKIHKAYGDSRGDREMLHAADVSYWRPFRLFEHGH